jgi:hypothetical protein
MLKTFLATFTALLISLLMIDSRNVVGQTSNTQIETQLEGLRATIAHSFGTEGSTVEVILGEHVLTVSRLNSYLNDGSHVDRNNEAVSIVSVIQREVSGKPELKDILIIRVQYILNAKDSAERKVIDTIEFRKNQSGVFEFHST